MEVELPGKQDGGLGGTEGTSGNQTGLLLEGSRQVPHAAPNATCG